MNELKIDFRWTPIECSTGEQYCYPLALSKFLKHENAKPGIYRWAVYDSQGKLKEAYIGETEDLQNRLYQYLHPGKSQQTNLRLKAHLDSVKLPERVIFEVLGFDPFKINGFEFSNNSLSNPHVRKLLEGLVIASTVQGGCQILNFGKDSREKQVEQAVAMLPNLSTQNRNRLVRHYFDIIRG